MKHLGYIIIEHCENYEQPLGLRTGKELPPGGLLEWTDGPRAVFQTRKAAWAAVERTDCYRRAFNRTDLPEKRFCKAVPLKLIQP